MDLKETKGNAGVRHPWETARLKALRRILGSCVTEGMKVLDVGCGDGFISKQLFSHLINKKITAVDINLSEEYAWYLNKNDYGMVFQRDMPAKEAFDLVMLLDVIEHVEHDQLFLSSLVEKYLHSNGKIIITAPAFQFIYGRHDVFLEHYRRYNLKQLTRVATESGLSVVSSGYLFATLLIPKLILYKLLNIAKATDGVGNWNRGRIVTSIVNMVLNIDNRFLIFAGRFGVKLPGLTGWILCEKLS